MAATASIEARSRIHAALGEPVRLAIVDHLSLGDASPGELGSLLAVSTNLLAHHLRVLEAAGLIRRIRSEGDQRRTYVQLCLDEPIVADITGAAPAVQAVRIVFVCTRNSARSQLAAAAWNRAHDVPATCAGTQPAPRVHPMAITVGRRHGLRLGRAKTADAGAVLRPGDLVVAVCDTAYEELGAAHGDAVLHWAVPDPARIGTEAAFERAYRALAARVDRLALATTPVRAAARRPNPDL